jgi:hypothetical protein
MGRAPARCFIVYIACNLGSCSCWGSLSPGNSKAVISVDGMNQYPSLWWRRCQVCDITRLAHFAGCDGQSVAQHTLDESIASRCNSSTLNIQVIQGFAELNAAR